ncbi:MAG: flagellar biosynthetic protein FliR [Rhodopila sp.]
MSPTIGELLDWAPALALVVARIGPAMALLPGLGESAAPVMVRAGLALALSVLLVPLLAPAMPPMPDTGLRWALAIAGEVVTGLWFGWLARVIALALPVGIQLVSIFLGLTSVLQPDEELGPQSTAFARLFDLAVPVIILSSGMYTLVLQALAGLFTLIPPGHLLPAGDGVETVVATAATAFKLALQVASPFVVAAVAWQIAMGQVARVMSRVQIFFVMMPGQILAGLVLLGLAGGGMIAVWQQAAEHALGSLPGSG